MSQYRDPFIGGGGSRNRDNSEEYVYRRREEDDRFQYSPTSGDTGYGFGSVPVTDMDGRSTSRPTQKPQRPQQPMSSRQGGNGGQTFPIPPVPRVPGNNSNGSRGPPPRPVRPNYVPSNLDLSEVKEVQNPNFSYRLNQQPIRTQLQYSQQSDDDCDPISPTNPPTNRPSVSSSRSIFIGFDPSNSPAPSTSSLGVIPNFPPVPPLSGSNRRSSGAGPPPSARRGTSSYYSQQTLMVSPIPEESLSSASASADRHGSYASSAAIPSGWDGSPLEYYHRDDVLNDSDEYESRIAIDNDIEEERGLVRQASLGRKSKPVITEIRSSDRLKTIESKSSGSNDSFKTGRSVAGGSVGVGRTNSRSPAEKSSPTLNPIAAGGSESSLPSIVRHAQSPVPSSSNSSNSPIIQPPAAYITDDYMSEKFSYPRRSAQTPSPALTKEFGGGSASDSQWEPSPTSTKLSGPVGGISGRRIPPRLNMDAVREAEARGSLTSLPDLIRRATKLAAVLESGRPDSRWGMRGSYMGNSSTSMLNFKLCELIGKC